MTEFFRKRLGTQQNVIRNILSLISRMFGGQSEDAEIHSLKKTVISQLLNLTPNEFEGPLSAAR